MQELNWRWYQPLAEQARIEADLVETLRTLKAMDLKLGIVSNTFINGSSLDRHLEQVGLLEFFEMRLYSYELPCRKPDRRIFDEAVRRIGVEAGRILFVGDRIDKDVIGSRQAGMIPVLKRAYTNNGKAVPAGTAVIERLAELPELVCRSHDRKPAQPVTSKLRRRFLGVYASDAASSNCVQYSVRGRVLTAGVLQVPACGDPIVAYDWNG